MGRARQNETVEGVDGWACKNEGGKARIFQNEHLGAHFRKSEGWGGEMVYEGEAESQRIGEINHHMIKFRAGSVNFNKTNVRK